VIAGGDRNGLYVTVVEDTSQVLVQPRLLSGHVLELAAFFTQAHFVRITECRHFDTGYLCQQTHMVAPSAPHTDNCHANPIARRHAGRLRHQPPAGSERCASHEVSSFH
jgi:hypothetical protein